MTSIFSRIVLPIRRFMQDRRGNILIITVFSFLPIIGFLSLAIDVGLAIEARSKLDSAADAAAITGITAANTYLSSYTGTAISSQTGANNCTSTQSLQCAAQTIGTTAATQQFYANAGLLPNQGTLSLIGINFSVGASTVTGSISYAYTRATSFASIMGFPTITVSSTITSSLSIPRQTNIYFVIDNSESMGIGATAADQATMYNSQMPFNGGQGCALACHVGNSASEDAAHLSGAQLRIDLARNALVNALNIIKSANSKSISVAIYVMNNNITKLYALSNNIDGAITAANTVDLADTVNSPQNAGSNITYSLKQLAAQLPAVSGALSNNYVILLTDGMQDNSWYLGNGNAGADPNFVARPDEVAGRWQEIDSSACQTIQAKSYTMMTLYTPYQVPSAAYMTPGYQWAYTDVEQAMPNLAGAMQQCASAMSDYISAADSAGMNAAMAAFASKILQQAQLTN
jgi:Flp pilus assembly protein TadG